MAKGKHSIALFEVIQQDRMKKRRAVGADALRTPTWWFKGRAVQAEINPDSPLPPPTPPRVVASPASIRLAAIQPRVSPTRQTAPRAAAYGGAPAGPLQLLDAVLTPEEEAPRVQTASGVEVQYDPPAAPQPVVESEIETDYTTARGVTSKSDYLTPPAPTASLPPVWAGFPSSPTDPAAAPAPAPVDPPGPSLRAALRAKWDRLAARSLQLQSQLRAKIPTKDQIPWLANLPLTPASAAIIGGSAAAVVAVACVVGPHRARPAAPAPAGAVAALNEPRPNVLDVHTPKARHAAGSTAAAGGAAARAAKVVEVSDPAPAAPKESAESEPGGRKLGVNYVLVQSYADEQIADDAVAALAKAGIPATIEHGVKGWRKELFLVIGLEGFTRISGPEYAAYVKKVEAVSKTFAPAKSYKEFSPHAIKWDRAS